MLRASSITYARNNLVGIESAACEMVYISASIFRRQPPSVRAVGMQAPERERERESPKLSED